jgi:hypothetical protein
VATKTSDKLINTNTAVVGAPELATNGGRADGEDGAPVKMGHRELTCEATVAEGCRGGPRDGEGRRRGRPPLGRAPPGRAAARAGAGKGKAKAWAASGISVLVGRRETKEKYVARFVGPTDVGSERENLLGQ